MMKDIFEISKKETLLAVGLMAGTSLDGVDAALVEVNGFYPDIEVKLIDFVTLPFSGQLRGFILKNSHPDTARLDEITRLNFLLGEAFADAAHEVISKAGYTPKQIDIIGSHGQTIYHLPEKKEMFGKIVAGTLQTGEPAVIAHRTSIVTVSDFRKADMAVGGEGAPLMPFVDEILFSSEKGCEVALNIGGIANATFLPPKDGDHQIVAFDTGPGNMVIDALVKRFTGEQRMYDDGGEIAMSGTIKDDLLERMLKHPYLQQALPKSTGREMFGADYVDWLVEAGRRCNWKDLVATATSFTVRTILSSINDHLAALHPVDRLIVSGGGAFNRYIMKCLSEGLPEVEVIDSDNLGIPADAKEAIGFALLAVQTLRGVSSNVPDATGATEAVILGNITRVV